MQSPRARSEADGRGKGKANTAKSRGKGKARAESPGSRRFIEDYSSAQLKPGQSQSATDLLREFRDEEIAHYSIEGWHPAYRNSFLMKMDPNHRAKVEADFDFREMMRKEPVSEREFCKSCGTMFIPDSSFCRRCGERRTGGPEPAELTQPAQATPESKTESKSDSKAAVNKRKSLSTLRRASTTALRRESSAPVLRQRRTIAGGQTEALMTAEKFGGGLSPDAGKKRAVTPSQTAKRKTVTSHARDARQSLLQHIASEDLVGVDLRRDSVVINTPWDEAEGIDLSEYQGMKLQDKPLRMRASIGASQLGFDVAELQAGRTAPNTRKSEFVSLDPSALVALQRPREREFMLALEGNIINGMLNDPNIDRIELNTPIEPEFRYLVHSVADYYGLQSGLLSSVPGEKKKVMMTLTRTANSRLPERTLEKMCEEEGVQTPGSRGSRASRKKSASGEKLRDELNTGAVIEPAAVVVDNTPNAGADTLILDDTLMVEEPDTSPRGNLAQAEAELPSTSAVLTPGVAPEETKEKSRVTTKVTPRSQTQDNTPRSKAATPRSQAQATPRSPAKLTPRSNGGSKPGSNPGSRAGSRRPSNASNADVVEVKSGAKKGKLSQPSPASSPALKKTFSMSSKASKNPSKLQKEKMPARTEVIEV
jgi:hypothetical protein